MGKSAQLPCQCTGNNSGEGKLRVEWKDSHGKVLVLSGILPLRKYTLINDKRRLKVEGDCSLHVYMPQQEDQGDYRCSFYDPRFGNERSELGFRVHIVTLMIKDLSPIGDFTVTKGVQEQPTTVTTPRVSSTQMKLVTLASETTKTVHTSTQATTLAMTSKVINATTGTTSLTSTTLVKTTKTSNMTSLTFKDVVNVTQKLMLKIEPSGNNSNEIAEVREQMMEENNADSSVTAQRTISDLDNDLFDSDLTPEYVTNQYHTVQKRDIKWKAYGFDSSVLRIADPWASRNLWFQQLTHSVRSVTKLNGPCVVKIPSPNSWSAILETVPEPLTATCQYYALSWLLYKQQSAMDVVMAMSVHLFKPRFTCSWLSGLPYENVLDQHEDIKTAVPEIMEVTSVRANTCFCSNETHNGPGMFMGISDCDKYMMDLGKNAHKTSEVTFHVPYHKQNKTLKIENQSLPGNVTIGNFKDVWWVCGDKAYIFLPYGWTGCCYMALLKLPYEVLTFQKGKGPDEVPSNDVSGSRRKRELAQFHNLEAYHWRISIGEKWGIGLFPWYGVTFLADHIDNITYTLQGFANETIRGFEFLSNTQKSHRLTLLKHDMALDYILAKQGGLCMALNLTGDACYTLIPDSSDNMTSVIGALKLIRDAFGPSENAGWSANAWLQDRLGPVGAVLVQILAGLVLALCVMFCFCTLLLTFAKVMIMRWVGVVMPGDQTQMPLLHDADTDIDEDNVIRGVMVESYPF